MKRWISRTILTLFGWRIEGTRPLPAKYVLIAAPHTSNWDFPLMLLFAAAFDVKVSWMGKQSLFTPPVGWIMRALGGVPIRRGTANNIVDNIVQTFAELPSLVLVVPTEGTRARVEFWKSGFYHIARQARVPIVPSYLDYGKKRGGFGPALTVSGDPTLDMDHFRDFYAPMLGLFPEEFGPVRLREEAQPSKEMIEEES